MASFAMLPMAVVPEQHPAEAALWSAVGAALVRRGVAGVPPRLSDGLDPRAAWREPDLLFGQTCGYPLILGLDRSVRLVATPAHLADGCAGSDYSSAIVVRSDDPARRLADLRGRVCAYNGVDSQSGYNALRLAVSRIADGQPFFSSVVETGGHVRSLAAVAGGRADVAAIDCVGLAAIGRYRPAERARVRILTFTDRAPGLPYITGARTSDETLAALREALQEAMGDADLSAARESLLLAGVELRSRADYDVIGDMESEARRLGYPVLR